MNHALHKPMTVDEFLAWEDQQERKWEFDGFAPVATVGGTHEHAVIGGNICAGPVARLPMPRDQQRTQDQGCRPYPLRDAFVICTPVLRGNKVVSEPVVVFEVLSESTRRTDQFLKTRSAAIRRPSSAMSCWSKTVSPRRRGACAT